LTSSHSHLRRPLLARAALVLALALLAGCGTEGDNGTGNPDSNLSESEATAPLEGAPTALAKIRSQASQLLDGGTDAFEARLEQLRGTPVVVNKWASWCGPCRLEFPHFQSVAEKRGGEIAFLGVDANDSDDAARTFLEQLPLPYPSYTDPSSEIAELIEAPRNFPSTAFYDRAGELVYTFQGVYSSEEQLASDVARYAR
jgi:cytochrome c biogenesis protein CcmG/thiol:disulfide interchange protein DsbE